MKYLLSLFIFLFPVFSFAQDENIDTASSTGTQQNNTGSGQEIPQVVLPECNEKYSIVGPTAAKVNTPYEYSILDQEGTTIASGATLHLIQGEETLETISNQNKYIEIFSKAGNYTLLADITNTGVCIGPVSLEIQSYNRVISYFNARNQDDSYGDIFQEQFEDNHILFEYFPIAEKMTTETMQAYWKNIEESDILIFGYGDILNTFSQIGSIQKITNIDFSEKRIYIISNYSYSFLSKVLALSLAQIGTTEVSLIDENQFSRLINEWSLRNNLDFSTGRVLSYEKKGGFFTLSSFLEFLAYGGISYQFLGFLLVLTCIALLFNIFKQVIGLYVFGIYYPILFAIILTHASVRLAILFFVIAFLSVWCVLIISRWIHLLFNAKRALLISIYILLIFLALGLDNFFELDIFTYESFSNILIIVPLFATLFIAEKVFQDGGKILSRGWFFTVFQFIFVTGIAYLLLGYQTLQYFLISYPDVIFIIIFLNILVGRYLGLQVFEYVRFNPILKNINDEEE